MNSGSSYFDFHTHIFPEIPFGIGEKIHPLRRTLRKLSFLNPLAADYYLQAQEWIPRKWQDRIETLDILPIAYQALIEGTYRDYIEIASQYKIAGSLVVAQPPFAENNFVLDLCKEDQTLHPCLQFDIEKHTQPIRLEEFHKKGVRCLKFHGASSGIRPDDPRVLSLVEQANDLEWVVVVHTGVLQIPGIFKDPTAGSVLLYKDWLKRHPNLKVVFAHSNIKDYKEIKDLTEISQSFYVTTSWQTESSILWLKENLGAERILFASDWPTVGYNQHYATRKLENLLRSDELMPIEFDQISRGNAHNLLAN
ncbi:MAG: amidohydrolase family protein [Pseudomonadota bacterium]